MNGKYYAGFQGLQSSGLLLLHSFSSYTVLYYALLHSFKERSDAASYVASYLKAQDASSEEEPEEFEPLECADFDPFMALYLKCKTELPALEKQKFLYKAQCNIRENPIMVDIIRKMFDFDLEVSELDNKIF